MKKFIVGFVCGAVLFSAIPVFAGGIYQKVEAFIRGDVKVVSNGEQVQLSKPVLSYNGGTYLYVRDVAKVFDKNVTWNSASQTVGISNRESTTGETTEKLPSQTPEILKDYLPSLSPTPALKINGVIYVPLRAGADKYDIYHFIEYESSTKTVSFRGTNIKVEIPEQVDFANPGDGFTYQWAVYIKESFMEDASKLIHPAVTE